MLADLIERLEKLEGPDRETDQAIDLFFNPTASVWSPKWWSGAPNEFLIWGSEEAGDLDYRHIDDLTSSLDAAIALAILIVDDGMVDIEVAHRSIGGVVYGRAEICGPQWYGASDHVKAGPAVALLIALLKAKEGRNG